MSHEPTIDETIAQRPRLVSRLRLVPLAVLCTLVAGLAVVGVLNDGAVTGDLPAAAAQPQNSERAAKRAARDAERAKKACTPGYDDGVRREPWRGAERATSEAAYQRAIKKEDPTYVRGKKRFLFFTDYQNDNFSQALGRKTQSKKQQKAWVSYLKKSAAAVRAAGGDYRVVVMPAKWDVHPEKLPAWAQRLRGTTSLVRLMDAHPELPWIDTRAALKKAARKHDTYEPLNSHWTPYGGYVAWQVITRCLGASNPALAGLSAPPITGVGIGANLNEFAPNGVRDGKPARTFPVYAQPHPATTTTHEPDGAPLPTAADFVTDTLEAPLKTSTPGAQAPGLTMLTLRDSTGNALSPLYSASFGTTVQFGHGIAQSGISPPDLGKLMATYHPQLVLLVVTERFLSEKAPR